MSEQAPAVDTEAAPAVLSMWEVMMRTCTELSHEIVDPYTSRERLRKIAHLAVVQVMAMAAAAQQAEAQEAAAVAKAREIAPKIISLEPKLVIP